MVDRPNGILSCLHAIRTRFRPLYRSIRMSFLFAHTHKLLILHFQYVFSLSRMPFVKILLKHHLDSGHISVTSIRFRLVVAQHTRIRSVYSDICSVCALLFLTQSDEMGYDLTQSKFCFVCANELFAHVSTVNGITSHAVHWECVCKHLGKPSPHFAKINIFFFFIQIL